MTPPEPGSIQPIEDAILRRISEFGQLLRRHDFIVGLSETADAARVAQEFGAGRPSIFRQALKALYCSRPSDWKQFDALFDSHWLGRGVKRVMRIGGSSATTTRPAQVMPGSPTEVPGLSDELADQVSSGAGTDGGATAKSEGASSGETHTTRDFRKIAEPAELERAHAAAERLARAMRTRLSRRERARKRGHRIDLRATIRRSIGKGGVPLELRRRRRKTKPLRLVVLLDASGSMQMYTAVFTRFIHGVLDSFREAEAFVFHTRLAHVSAALRERSPIRAVERMSLMSAGVGGGTRIGESLATFNRWHARRVLNTRSCLMILSDGYDTGAPAALAQEMQRLRRRCRRIVWLNPMMGWDGYRPDAKAMQAALPYIDLFAPAHNLESLAALEPYLARL
jgi:uncharacterized protein with von Willebrand factor type A (vWA) domain